MFNLIETVKLSEDDKCTEIKMLVEKNPVALDARQFGGLTPLHFAVQKNCPKVAKTIIELGCPVDINSDTNLTPLHIACEDGLSNLVLLLGFHHANFNLQDAQGDTALHKAISNKHPACVENLLIASAFKIDKTIVNAKGLRADDLLRQTTHPKDQEELANAYTKTANLFNRSPLHIAVINNLLEQHLSEEELASKTQLLLEKVQLYLDLNAPLNEKDCEGKTPLHYAAQCGPASLFEMLYKQTNSLIGVRDNYGKTPLHYAAQYGQAHILLQLCYTDDIDIDSVDLDGNSALHLSLKANQVKCVKTLVSAKRPADKSLRNNDKLNAYDLAGNSRSLQEALTCTQITNAQNKDVKERIYNFELASPTDLNTYLLKHFEPLSHSIKSMMDALESPRRLSDGNLGRMLKRKHSTSPRNNSNNIFIETQHPSLPVYQSLESSFLVADVASVVKEIKAKDNFDLIEKEIHQLFKKHPKTQVSLYIRDVIDELKLVLAGLQKDIEKQYASFQDRLQTMIGLKLSFTYEEINEISQEKLIELANQKEGTTLFCLQILAEIFNGDEINKTDRKPSLDKALTSILGLIDKVEPHQIIAYLGQLNPLFSTIQSLQSHYLVLKFLELGDYYGYDPLESLLALEIKRYVDDHCNEEIKKLVGGYSKDLVLKRNKLKIFVANVSTLIADLVPLKENIQTKIIDFVNHYSSNIKHNKQLLSCIHFVAREFNSIQAEFYQNLELKEFRKNCWERESSLLEHSKLASQMTEFINKTIANFNTPQRQAHAITLFIWMARECLHYQQGPEMTTIMSVICALRRTDFAKAFELLEKQDKQTLSILENLECLMKPAPNFKAYRNFSNAQPQLLPLFEVYFRDKQHLDEQSNLKENAYILGSMHKTLFFIKKSLSGLSISSHSDLYDQIINDRPSPRIELSLIQNNQEDKSSERDPSPKKERKFSLSHSFRSKETSRKEKAITLFSNSAPSSSQKEQDAKIERSNSNSSSLT